MLRVSPVSLNAISYNAVIRSLEIIRDGKIPTYKSSISSINQTEKSSSTVLKDLKPENVPLHKNVSDNLLDPPIVTNIFIDTVGDPAYYKNRLIQALGEDYGNFTIEKKADATYRVVSAASIIAKVTRDRLLKVRSRRIGYGVVWYSTVWCGVNNILAHIIQFISSYLYISPCTFIL